MAPAPAPAAVAPADTGDAPAQPDAPKNEHGRYVMKAAVGAAYRRLYEIPIVGGDIQLGFGAQWHEVAIYGTIGALYGSTQHGLLTRAYEIGFSVELREGRFGLGAALRSSYMYFIRATDGTAVDSTGIGVAPFVSFDVLPFDGHALYVNAKVNLDSFGGKPTTFVWGPTLSLGIRY